jgi:hypothetical protein
MTEIPREFFNFETKQYSVETFLSDEISLQMLRQVAELSYYVFGNDSTWEGSRFGLFPDSDEVLSAADFTNKRDNQGCVSVEVLKSACVDDFPLHEGVRAIPAFDWPLNYLLLGEKLEENAVLTVLRETGVDDSLLGCILGYRASLKKAFELEWVFPDLFSHYRTRASRRSFDDFLNCVGPQLEAITGQSVDEDFEVNVCNCVVIDQSVRAGGFFPIMNRQFLDSTPVDTREVPVLGETKDGTRMHRLLKRYGFKSVRGFLPNPYTFEIGDYDSWAIGANLRSD